MFKLQNQSLGYGNKLVLKDIDLEIKPGEVIALVGESGCGKSTLLSRLRELQANNVAWCPQQMGLVPVLSVFHNIYAGTLDCHSFFYNLRNLVRPKRQELAKVEEIALQLGLQDVLRISVDQLSGGQQQRVNIARAMIQDRPIFLGDEPVSALDGFQGPSIIRSITEKYSTCIFALQDLELALNECQRIIGIANGNIIFDAQIDELSEMQLSSIYKHHPIRTHHRS
ncbi:MAG: ATP-binding cassette domain-containing protein [Pseudomonadales bacterium]|nr:ATP-binding cassette domain-containing protein [Pseudomonadales bacterium]